MTRPGTHPERCWPNNRTARTDEDGYAKGLH